jgi:hypothetical protein
MNDCSWHRESMIRFYKEYLQKLGKGLFTVTCSNTGRYTLDLRIAWANEETDYTELPLPDDRGVFSVDGNNVVVIPIAEKPDFAGGTVLCAGEQVRDFFLDRIDPETESAGLPVDILLRDFLDSRGQIWDETNVCTRIIHPRRLLNPEGYEFFPESWEGIFCPVDTPEGKEGKVVTLASGASIVRGMLVGAGKKLEDRIGPVTSSIPFLLFNRPPRIQVALSLMRTCRFLETAEPALVRTGFEPEDPDFWYGRNLLTVYCSMGPETHEEGIVLRRGAAEALGFPGDSALGIRLANRHGQKGIVSAVKTDKSMPVLEDGTPADAAVDPVSIHARGNIGQLLEASVSWEAETEAGFVTAGLGGPLPVLPEKHKQILRINGKALENPSIAGRVYWGVSVMDSRNRMSVSRGSADCMLQGRMEKDVLLRKKAYRILREQAGKLAELQNRESEFSHSFEEVRNRLAASGIKTEGDGRKGLAFTWDEPEGEAVLELSVPRPHPWFPRKLLKTAARQGEERQLWNRLVRENKNTGKTGGLPRSLKKTVLSDFDAALKTYFSRLLTEQHMTIRGKVRRSARGMFAPDFSLGLDEIGLPSGIALDLFGRDEQGRWVLDAEEPESGGEISSEIKKLLTREMAAGRVLLNRAPTFSDTALTSFKPVPAKGPAVTINPILCEWFNLDFDGDQGAVFVMVSEETVREAEELLSVKAHLAVDSAQAAKLAPVQGAMTGLAFLSLTEEGRAKISRILRRTIPPGLLIRDNCKEFLIESVKTLEYGDFESTVRDLWESGFHRYMETGYSLYPGGVLELSERIAPLPDSGSSPEENEAVSGLIRSLDKYEQEAFGFQLLAVKSGARGSVHDLLDLCALISGESYRVFYLKAAENHRRITETMSNWKNKIVAGFPDYREYTPVGEGVIARAMRSPYPGAVFAAAAETGELDTLTDRDSRIFAGLGAE